MAALLLDSHVLHWLTAEENRVSAVAAEAVGATDDIAVAAITWWELALLGRRGRIDLTRPVRAWLDELARQVRTVAVTPAIADTAAALPRSFPRDPADRLIYATAIETGRRLLTKDGAIRDHDADRGITLW